MSKRRYSEATKAKISAAMTGNKNALGKKRSPETRAKMSRGQRKRFALIRKLMEERRSGAEAA